MDTPRKLYEESFIYLLKAYDSQPSPAFKFIDIIGG